MKRIVLAAIAVCLFLSGCSTTGTQTPAEIAANVAVQVKKACAVAQPTLASLQMMQSQLTADQQADVAKAETIVTGICSATVPVAPQSVAELVQTAFPLVIKLIDASPMAAQDKTTAIVALTAAQIAVSAALAQ